MVTQKGDFHWSILINRIYDLVQLTEIPQIEM